MSRLTLFLLCGAALGWTASPGWGQPQTPLASGAEVPGRSRPFVADDGAVRRVVGPQMQPVVARMLPTETPGLLPDGAVIANVALQRSHLDVQIRVEGGATLVMRLTPREGRATEGQSAWFEMRAVEVPPSLPSSRRAVLEAALSARIQATEAGFAWTEARAERTLGQIDPELQRSLEEIAALLARRETRAARSGLDALAPRWPLPTLELFAAWEVATLWARADRPEAAREAYDRVLERFQAGLGGGALPAAAWAKAAGANLALRGEKPARMLLRRCLEQAAGDKADCAPWSLAGIAALQGDREKAARWMDEALGDGQRASVVQLVERAALAARLGDQTAELRWAGLAAERFGDQPDALDAHASALFRARQYARAVALWQRRFDIDPQRPGVLGPLAGAFNRLGALARAGKPEGADYHKLLEALRDQARHRQPVARALLALDSLHRGDFAQGAQQLEALEEALGHEPQLWTYGALARHWAGEPKRASELLARAVALAPGDPEVAWCRSVVQRARDPKAAAADLTIYLASVEAAGAIGLEGDGKRLRQEITLLEQGVIPPEADRPGEGPGVPWWAWAAGMALVLGAGWWWRRRRR